MTPTGGKASAPAAVPGDRLDDLFDGPLEEFTSKRNKLEKELRADGEAKGAEWVKALRKPTRAAWIVNQLGARKRKELDAALERGEELRGLQEGMLAGEVDRDRLRQAAHAEQDAIAALMKTAEAIAREHGAGSQVIDRVAETLQAASSDPEVADAIARGRLQREARASSLGLVGPATAPPPARKPARKGGKAKPAAGGKREAARAAKAEQRDRDARREEAKRRRAAERTLATAERRIERERGVAERLREQLADRESRIAETEAEAERARKELEELG